MPSSTPRFTIIIPTLNRPDTLVVTLRTVLNQDYEHYSILVSDNASEADIKKVVDDFGNDRIRYIRTPHRMSMSHHWEFALSHVEEGYVTILGDDDGLLPGSLVKAAAIIKKHEPAAMGWKFSNFNWQGLPPHFTIPMSNHYRVVDAATEAERILEEGSIYHTSRFPSLYGGFIDIRLIRDLSTRFGGSFFHSRIPDFFSGALIAATVKSYIRLEFPLSVNATSKHSAGYATINSKNDQTAFKSLVSNDNNIPFHPKLIFIRSNVVPIAEAMLQVKELVPSFPAVNMKKVIREVIAEAAVADSRESYENLIKGIKEIAAINGLSDYCEQEIKKTTFTPSTAGVKQKFSVISNILYFNTTGTAINTVEDAVHVVNYFAPGNYFRLRWGLQQYAARGINFIKYLAWKVTSKYKNNI